MLKLNLGTKVMYINEHDVLGLINYNAPGCHDSKQDIGIIVKGMEDNPVCMCLTIAQIEKLISLISIGETIEF